MVAFKPDHICMSVSKLPNEVNEISWKISAGRDLIYLMYIRKYMNVALFSKY